MIQEENSLDQVSRNCVKNAPTTRTVESLEPSISPMRGYELKPNMS